MHRSDTRKWRAKTIACASILAVSVFGLRASAQAQAGPDKAVDSIKTETPSKHVIIIVGENLAPITFSAGTGYTRITNVNDLPFRFSSFLPLPACICIK